MTTEVRIHWTTTVTERYSAVVDLDELNPDLRAAIEGRDLSDPDLVDLVAGEEHSANLKTESVDQRIVDTILPA